LRGDWQFTDFVPPPLTGLVGPLRVSVRIWPPDTIPSYARAWRVPSGPLRDYWVVVEFL
jgi:hypothetical protein